MSSKRAAADTIDGVVKKKKGSICRICALPASIDITPTIREKISKICDIYICESEDQFICESCVDKLKHSVEFKAKCQNNDDIHRERRIRNACRKYRKAMLMEKRAVTAVRHRSEPNQIGDFTKVNKSWESLENQSQTLYEKFDKKSGGFYTYVLIDYATFAIIKMLKPRPFWIALPYLVYFILYVGQGSGKKMQSHRWLSRKVYEEQFLNKPGAWSNGGFMRAINTFYQIFL